LTHFDATLGSVRCLPSAVHPDANANDSHREVTIMGRITYDDQTFDLEKIRDQMDEELYSKLESDHDSDQDFFDAYVIAHSKKYGERFSVS
jgi:hypothetical protein